MTAFRFSRPGKLFAEALWSLDRPSRSPAEGPPLVLRTVYMDPKIDDRLRVEAFDARTRKNDFMRRYVWAGMSLETGG